MLDYQSNLTRYIHSEEIELFCEVKHTKPISVESIHNLVAGANTEYKCMEVSNSFECYQVLRAQLIKKLQETKEEMLFFEDRMNTDSNIIVCVVKNTNKSRQQAIFHALIRMTIKVEPNVGFCRKFELTGN